MSSTHRVQDHTLTLLHNGEEYFPRLIAAMDGASRSIYLETYIYAADDTGIKISAALQRAARRGVKVHVLLDGFGSAELPQSWASEMRTAGVDVLWFRKAAGLFGWRRYHLRRLHRKLALVDERIAFVGGINIIDDVPDKSITAARLDYAIELQGPVVTEIQAAIERLWILVSWTKLRFQRSPMKLHTTSNYAARKNVLFLVRDNVRHRRDIEKAYLKAITAARSEIIIANAYFLPGLRLRRALLKAARRGVRVILLLQGLVEYRLQHFATHALYDELLGGGIVIYEYKLSFLHAKVAVVDSQWATVGSSNIDPFSLWLAREANIAVDDASFAGALRTRLMHDIEGAVPVVPAIWQKKHGFWMRLQSRICYMLVRFLIGVTGYVPGREKF